MGVQDFIAIGVAVGAALWILRRFTKTFNGESGCGCSSKQSGSAPGSCSAKPRTGLKRQPLVPLDSVGLPDPTEPPESKR